MDNPFSSAPETAQNPPPVDSGASAPPTAGQPAISPAVAPVKGKASPEARAKFRYKYYRSKGLSEVDAAKKAGLGSVPEISTAPGSTGPVAPQVNPLPPVLHNPAAFKPLVTMLATAGEKASVGRLVRTASKISPELATKVKQDAPWNPEAKELLLETGPTVFARYAAKIGLPADTAEDVAFLSAVGMIVSGHITLANELAEIAAKQETANKEKEAK